MSNYLKLNLILKIKIIRLLRVIISRSINFLLYPIEKTCLLFVDSKIEIKYKPIFVIGPPRTGSTLITQVLINSFDVGYITNLMAWFFRAPYLICLLSNNLMKNKVLNYQSNRGKIKGFLSPNEGVLLFNRWFTGHNIANKKIVELRKTIIGISNTCKKTLLLKNIPNSIRVLELAEIFTEAVFIITDREEIHTARSILDARIKEYGRKDAWFGPGINFIEKKSHHKPYYEQVVDQVILISRYINECKHKIGDKKFLIIKYEDMCENPKHQIERVQTFLKKNNLKVIKKKAKLSPFKVSKTKSISDDDLDKIKNYAYKEYGILS
jgi:hypothetical protein